RENGAVNTLSTICRVATNIPVARKRFDDPLRRVDVSHIYDNKRLTRARGGSNAFRMATTRKSVQGLYGGRMAVKSTPVEAGTRDSNWSATQEALRLVKRRGDQLIVFGACTLFALEMVLPDS